MTAQRCIFLTDDLVLHGPIDEARMAPEDVAILRRLAEVGGEPVTLADAFARFGSGPPQPAQRAELENATLIPAAPPDGSYRVEPGQLAQMRDSAQQTIDAIRRTIAPLHPVAIAMIRDWRVELRYSWRAIALSGSTHRLGHWAPASNQLAGMALCSLAAEAHGENFREPPWNVRPCAG